MRSSSNLDGFEIERTVAPADKIDSGVVWAHAIALVKSVRSAQSVDTRNPVIRTDYPRVVPVLSPHLTQRTDKGGCRIFQ